MAVLYYLYTPKMVVVDINYREKPLYDRIFL